METIRLFCHRFEIHIALFSFLLAIVSGLYLPFLLIVYVPVLFLIIGTGIHPAAIGFSRAPQKSSYLSDAIRGFFLGYAATTLYTQSAYSANSLASPPVLGILIISELFWRGYFLEFMRRRGFNNWISLQCAAIPSVFFIYCIIDYSHPSLSILLILYILALNAGSVRLLTRNVWDAVLLHAGIYWIFLNISTLHLLFRHIINIFR
jgi:membrane protease YdiL (CAAX protease family)